jgi:hypothetical protein
MPAPLVFQRVYIDENWFPFKPVRVVIRCIKDETKSPRPDLWQSFHDYCLVYSVKKIGARKLDRVYRCTWKMIRCELPEKPKEGDRITVFLKPRSPLPWHLAIQFYFHGMVVWPFYSLARGKTRRLRTKGFMRSPIGTGGNPHVGLTTDPNVARGGNYNHRESIVVRA